MAWQCKRCGATRWVAASLTGPVGYGGKAIKQCVPCGWYSSDLVESAKKTIKLDELLPGDELVAFDGKAAVFICMHVPHPYYSNNFALVTWRMDSGEIMLDALLPHQDLYNQRRLVSTAEERRERLQKALVGKW